MLAGALLCGSLAYQYDAVGNRKTLNSTLPALVSGVWYYDANDRTTGVTGDTYDNDGNTIWRTGVQNTYDFENHLVQHGGISYVYDGDGNRKTRGQTGRSLQFSRGRPAAELALVPISACDWQMWDTVHSPAAFCCQAPIFEISLQPTHFAAQKLRAQVRGDHPILCYSGYRSPGKVRLTPLLLDLHTEI
jgi:hypothetical protein